MSSNRSQFADSVYLMDEKDRVWGKEFAEYLRFRFELSGDDYFYDLVKALRYVNMGEDHVAWTDKECKIFLNATKGARIGQSDEKWLFIFEHECLHQIWDTFNVGDEITREKGSYNHELLNIASDCVINDYIHNVMKQDYPTDGLITPEYIKDKYGVEYDRKADDQKSLYYKLEPIVDKLLRDPKIRKVLDEDAPVVNIPPSNAGGSSQPKRAQYDETTQDWKNGHEKAIYEANRILKDCYAKAGANDGDVDKVVKALEDAAKKIEKLKGKSSQYTFETFMSLFQHLRTSIMEAAGPDYQTFEQGWEKGIEDALKGIENAIGQLTGIGGGGQGGGGAQTIHEPDFNETEEELYLPKLPGTGGGQGDDKKDKKDSQGGGQGDDKNDKKDKKDGKGSGDGKKDKVEMPNEKQLGNDPAKANKPGQSGNIPKKKKVGGQRGQQGQRGDGFGEWEGNDSYSGGKAGKEIPGLAELQEELNSDPRTPKQIVEEYARRGLGGNAKGFFDKCKSSAKGPGFVAFSPKAKERGKWAKEFMTNATSMMRSKITQMERIWKQTYSRPNRRAGLAREGMPIKRGKMELKQGVTITLKFYIDVSGSMGQSSVNRCFEMVWAVCDKIKEQHKNNVHIKDFECIAYPFTEVLEPPVKYGKAARCHGGNMDFDELLNCMKDKSELAMLNVIITDAQWPINPTQSSNVIRNDISGNLIMITNSTSQGDIDELHEIENRCKNFKVILSDDQWNINL